jgi:hypothetical protein
LTLDEIDAGARPANISNPPGAYGDAVGSFWRQRASAIGAYVHKKMKKYYEDNPVAGLTYHDTGPDFWYTAK